MEQEACENCDDRFADPDEPIYITIMDGNEFCVSCGKSLPEIMEGKN